MPHDPNLDPAAILATLGVQAATTIEPVYGGADTAIWRVAHGAETSALRVYRREQAAAYQREIEALDLAGQAGVPVPDIRASGVWQERPALLLSWCRGQPIGHALRQQPWRVWWLGMAFGRTQARIHRISMPARWQSQSGDWIDWAGSEDRELRGALERLAQLQPALLHLDYHPLNVLADKNAITGVLDWANSRGGDPRADVARTYTILMVEPHTPDREPLMLSFMRRLLCMSWWRGYRQVAGEPANMPWFYAWAGAVMARDLAPRVANPQSWWQARHLEAIQRWTATQKARATRL